LFKLCAQYYRPPNQPRPADFKRDLKLVKDHGLNSIRTFLCWSFVEPVQGEYVFDEFDQLFDAAAEAGLKVDVWLHPEGAPYWLMDKYPDCLRVAGDGFRYEFQKEPTFECGGWPGPCEDHQAAAQAAHNFIARVADHYRNRDALGYWTIWGEPPRWPVYLGFVIDDNLRKSLCYCSNSVAKFRAWLQNKYASLKGLERAWQVRYGDWSYVKPPRIRQSYVDWVDWKRFWAENYADWLSARVAALKKVDKDHPVFAYQHQFSGLRHVFDDSDDLLLSKHVDIWGTGGQIDPIDPSYSRLCFAMDATRTLCRTKPFWVGESYFLEGGGGLSIFPYEHDTVIWGGPLLAFACGSTGVTFWQWRCEHMGLESPHYGATLMDGTPSRGAKAAKRFSEIVRRLEPTLEKSSPVSSEVGIVYDPRSFLMVSALTPWEPPPKPLNYEEIRFPFESLYGYYKMLYDLNIPADVVHMEQLRHEDNRKYKVLIFPFALIIDEIAARNILKCMDSDVHVIADACFGLYTDNCYASDVVPPHGLAGKLGARQVYYRSQKEIPMTILNGNVVGSRIRAQVEPLEGSEIVGLYPEGDPCAVLSRTGFFVGSPLGPAYLRSPAGHSRLMTDLLAKFGVKTPATTNEGVTVKFMQNPEGKLIFVVNNTKIERQAVVCFDRVLRKVADPVSAESVSFVRNTVKVPLSPYEVRPLLVEPV